MRHWTFLTKMGLILAVVVAGCGGGGDSAPCACSHPEFEIATLELSPSAPTIAVDQFQSFSAMAMSSAGTQLTEVTFRWASSDSTVATIDANGLAKGIAPGQATISVSASGKSASTTLTVIADPIITPPPAGSPFASITTYAAGPTPQGSVAADFNGDGAIDLVTANFDGNNLSFLPGLGDGTFGQPPLFLPAGRMPASLVAGDFNGDGKADLIVGNLDSQNVLFLAGKGDGAFETASSLPFSGQPFGMVAVDLDKDRMEDLAVIDIGKNELNLFYGQENGAFAVPLLYATGNGPSCIVSGDVDGDGWPDVIVANGGDATVFVFLNDPTSPGQLLSPDTVSVGDQPVSMTVGDLNADGRLDLLVANKGSDTISVLVGRSSGGFDSALLSLPAGSAPASVALADFDGNDKPDLAVARSGGIVTLFSGNGDGTFQTPGIDHNVGARPGFLITGLFDNDLKPDLAALSSGNNTVSILIPP